MGSFSAIPDVFLFIAELADLRAENKVTQGYKYTKASAGNVVSAIRQWLFFTTYFHQPILPASVDSLMT